VPPKRKPASRGSVPPLPKVAEDLKPAVAFLERELASWPQVTAKPMFGMTAFYRGKRIFAALPRTRAMLTPNSISYKVPARAAGRPGQGWKSLEVLSDADLREALQRLNQAYEAARPVKK
jgi:hypothetical protein